MAFSNNSMAEKTAAEIAEDAAKVATGQSTDAKASEAKSTEVDYEILYIEANKKAADWQKGYEKYKAIAKKKEATSASDDETEQLPLADLVQQEVSRALAGSEAEIARKNAEDIALKAIRENKELKKALQNRPATTSNNVTSQDAIEVRDNSVSPELERSVKARFRGDEATKSRKFEEWKRNRRS